MVFFTCGAQVDSTGGEGKKKKNEKITGTGRNIRTKNLREQILSILPPMKLRGN